MARILIVDDDLRTAREISSALADNGYSSIAAGNGIEAITKARTCQFDAIILDQMLPGGLSGLEVLAALRGTGVTTPVLILSALSAVSDRVRGLRSGGDDYLTKPFDFLELTARLDSLIRRSNNESTKMVELFLDDLHIDLLRRTVRRSGQELDLSPREYKLLEYFVRNAGSVMTRAMIFEEVWGYHCENHTNVIDVHVAKLRRKLEVPGKPIKIETVRGAGYRFVAV